MPSENNLNISLPAFLQGGGAMGELIRSLDWATTALGDPVFWPATLKQTVSMMLTIRYPVLICWGREYIQLYNDSFRPINGATKHPQAMGGSARDTYAEIWETIGPMFKAVMSGETFGFPDFMVPLDRNGHLEDCYFDFSYSPIYTENGDIGGVLVICMETTEKVLSLRKLQESYAEQQALNDEISSINEELAASNEELRVSNEDLLTTQQDLYESLIKLHESESRFRVMAESSDIMIAVSDETSNAIYFNKAWTDLTGRPLNDLLKFGWADLIHTDDRDQFVNIYLSAFKEKVPFSGEFRVLSKDGIYRWLMASGPPRFNTDGSFAGYISSCVDITARKQDEIRKNDFIGMVSHELKTPLTSITAIVQVLNTRLKNSDDAFVPGALDKAYVQVRKMSNMINGFLNVSRLESGKIMINKHPFNLVELVEETIREIEFTVTNHVINFEPGDMVIVNADRDKIGSVINNLLSNAIKYSPKGKMVEITCGVVGNDALVSINDEGIGIKPEDKEKLFERYYRVENNHTRHISGFGIGLYLSAEIINRHKGKIWVESEIGSGSTFYFSLPVVA